MTRMVAANSSDSLHPFLVVRPLQKVGLIVVAGDKGLAGSHNANVLRAAEEFMRQQSVPVVTVLVGNKAKDYGRRRGWNIVGRLDLPQDTGKTAESIAVVAAARRLFESGEVDAVYVAYTEFLSPIRRVPRLEQLLPMVSHETPEGRGNGEYIYEPAAPQLLSALLTRTLEARLTNMLLQSVAAEHAARMTSMTAATENADELRVSLTRQLNRERQQQITTQILEVISGAEALAQK
jgi:F-type H+-transporting ATPase subunit gamma